MIGRFLGRSRTDDQIATDVYALIVAQARQPAFYSDLGVPDTVDGRFEMIVLHLVLFFHRLQADGPDGQARAQRIFDVFVEDMDRSLREMGVGDLGVPKRMKDVGRSFYGRLDAYGKPLAENDRNQFEEALSRNVFPEETDNSSDTAALASYGMRAAAHLRALDSGEIASGAVTFPEVVTAEPIEAA